jgi:hypothetical protein
MTNAPAQHGRAFSRARRTIFLAFGSLAALTSCDRDKIVAPVRQPLPTEGSVNSAIPNDSALRALESPLTSTTHIAIQANGNGSPYPVIGSYATKTIVQAQITGSAAATPWSAEPWTFTPRGFHDTCGGWMPTVSNAWSECSASRYLAVTGNVALLASLPLPANCGQPTYPACPTFSGGFDAQLTRLDATIAVSPPDTSLRVNGSATFRWAAVPDSLQGIKTPTTLERWYYAPDSTGWPGDTAVGCYVVGNTCRVTPQASGMLHLWIMVNGKLEHKTAHVMVPSLLLKAVPAAVHPGQLVTFTPSWSDNTAINTDVRWEWAADAPPGRTAACDYSGWNYVCRTNVYESGTMTVFVGHWGVGLPAKARVRVYSTFGLDADRTTVQMGDTVTFTPKYDGVAGPAARWRWAPTDTSNHDATACDPGVSPCKKRMITSGRMWAYTATSGGDSASVLVTVLDKFELRAAPSLVKAGGVVTFRPYLNGQSVPAARWKWKPQGTGAAWDSVAGCTNNVSECHRATFVSGVMWAFRSQSGGDSASADITVSAACGSLFTKVPRITAKTASTTHRQSTTSIPVPQPARATSISCGDSSATTSDAGTDALPTVQLHVVTETPGIEAIPDTGTSSWPAGTVVPFQFMPKAGYDSPVVAVDDTLLKRDGGTVNTGTVVMALEHTIRSATDTTFALRPGISALRQRLRALVNSTNKPQAYSRYLIWALDSVSNSRLDDDIKIAEYLEFDPVADSASWQTFDDAMANYAFEIDVDATGQHTVTVIPPMDSLPAIVANRVPGRKSSSNPAATSTMSAIGTRIIFVNGIRTLEGGAINSHKNLNALLAGEHLANYRVTYYWNRNLRGEILSYAEELGCDRKMSRDGTFRARLVTLARGDACQGLRVRANLQFDDLTESVRQFIQLHLRIPVPATEDSRRLANLMAYYHNGYYNTVMVTHSQGNMVYAQAVNLLPDVEGVPNNTTRCTAALSLAAPINSEEFSVNGVFLSGMTINGDMLLRIPLPNNFLPRYNSQNALNAQAAIDRTPVIPGYAREFVADLWGPIIHDVDDNYFSGLLAGEVASRIHSLYDVCRTRFGG